MHGTQTLSKVVIFEVDPAQKSDWAGLASPSEALCVNAPLTADNAADYAQVEILSTFLRSRLDASVLGQMPNLKLIATRSTGYDHIDLKACAASGIKICNVPAYGDPTVAEFTFALLLALSRKITSAGERARHGDFSRSGLRGFDLAGKVLGVVGVGRIGQRVIQIARGFGMTVLCHDAVESPDLSARLGFSFVKLEALLKACDVLSLHVPGNSSNIGLISTPQLALMKPTAVVINTSRGEVIDAEALVLALSEGRLAGAGLDVFAQEGLLRDEVGIFRPGEDPSLKTLRSLAATHALLDSPNVLATAHIAYDTGEAVGRILSVTRQNIESFIAGAPENLVGQTRVRRAPKAPAAGKGAYELAMSPLSEDVIQRRREFLANPGPEQVHALRGALRRARAGLLMFKDLSTTGECTWIRHELERMIKQLGPLRDLDVLRVQYELDLPAPSGVFPEGFGNLLVSARAMSVEHAFSRLKSPREAFLLDGFHDWLMGQAANLPGQDLQAHMVAWLTEVDAEVRSQGDDKLARGKSARHRLREQIKVLKYDFEIYRRIFDPEGGVAYLQTLEALHTLLGDMNDDAVGARLRHSLVNPKAPPKDVGRPSKARREALARAWSHFDELPRSWATTSAAPRAIAEAS